MAARKYYFYYCQQYYYYHYSNYPDSAPDQHYEALGEALGRGSRRRIDGKDLVKMRLLLPALPMDRYKIQHPRLKMR